VILQNLLLSFLRFSSPIAQYAKNKPAIVRIGVMTAEEIVALSAAEVPPPPLPLPGEVDPGDVPVVLGACED
jgi:hypothetical protein